MRHTRSTAVLAAVLSAMGLTATGLSDVIVDQPDALEGGIASQVFGSPYEGYSCSAFDDFTITDAYNLTALTVYGENGTGSGDDDIAITVRFLAAPDLGSTTIASATGLQSGGVLTFDLTGITLAAGTYWIAAQVEREFDLGGQWFWRLSTTTNGAQAMWQNPGGAFGYGSNPVTVDVLGQSRWDMAFTLEGTIVPTPGALALLAAAGLCARRRR
ncbi:MAG: hypothetical protein GC172_13450 [Phycisphaera sp.]|nr:hypothetical protein [Phycisphaera sp.]